MKLTAVQVEHIAKLARLQLGGQEAERFSRQLSDILEYVEVLARADIAGVEPLAHVVPVVNVLRPDELAVADEAVRRRLIEAFPEREGDLLKVQAVFDQQQI
ncbi:MAG: Asp-tRNA(Asn)/Glu-tRNA(Gln) amidotransferase subunit GatC [Patescibacteria group bacterium]|jgi:aspartyl-tRNA(Asn)/glutamyl-tRNA(Gln) amidotransferase subunit C